MCFVWISESYSDYSPPNINWFFHLNGVFLLWFTKRVCIYNSERSQSFKASYLYECYGSNQELVFPPRLIFLQPSRKRERGSRLIITEVRTVSLSSRNKGGQVREMEEIPLHLFHNRNTRYAYFSKSEDTYSWDIAVYELKKKLH